MGAIGDAIKSFGPVRLVVMGTLLAGVAAFFFFLFSRLQTQEMALLYSDLDMADGAQIVSRLESMNVPVDLRGGGTQIYVPSDQVARLRMSMAEAGLPAGGSMGYEIFDRTDVLGTTSFVQDINHVRALEGELARTVKTISSVGSVRVHLVLPKKDLFSREQQPPSASVVLKMKGGARLSPSQVQAVQHLVAAAVPGLGPGQISIIDDKGTLLSKGGENSEIPYVVEEARDAYEQKVAKTVESLLEKSIGPGKVKAEVSVEMDLDRITENSEIFDPDGQVVRSTQTAEAGESSQDKSTKGAASVQANVPNAVATQAAGSGTATQSKKTEETVNYEISKTIKTHVKESGAIKRLSVAVLVDGAYTKGADGKETYAPRPKEELDSLTKLVKTAVGFKEDRGDVIEVVNMQFFAAPDLAELPSSDLFMGFTRGEVIRIAESLVFALVSLFALLFVIRPLMSKVLEGTKPQALNFAANTSLPGVNLPGANIALPPNLGGNTAASDGFSLPPPPQDSEAMMAIDRIKGNVKVSSVKKIEEIIDSQPETAVNVIRGWLHEGASR